MHLIINFIHTHIRRIKRIIIIINNNNNKKSLKILIKKVLFF